MMDSIKTYPESESWTLGSKNMPIVESTIHMGILRTSTNQEMRNVETNIQKGKRTVYSLMGSGLHGENGQDPETALSLQDCPTYIHVHTEIATLIDLLHYHSRRLVYVLHMTRYCQLPVTVKCTKKGQGTVNHTKWSN